MRRFALWVCLSAGAAALAQDAPAPAAAGSDGLRPRVKLVTSVGDIVLELDAEKAPVTVHNFVRYAEDNFYDGLIFHRIVPNFMIQGGGFTPELDEKETGLRPSIKNEWQNGLKNVRGSIAMARTQDPDSATAQFFINVVDNNRLDQPISGGAGYAVFGQVVEGLDVVDKIKDTPTKNDPKLPMGNVVPTEPIIIKDVEIVTPLDKSKVEAAVAKVQEEAAKAQAEAAGKWRERWPEDVKAFIAKQEQEQGKPAKISPTGLTHFTLIEGTGPQPKPTDKVMTHYTGWLINGKKFDSSVDRGAPFPVNLQGGVIEGWLEALRDMKVGEKRKIILPPKLAYGKRGAGADIPPDSYLVFDVELLAIK